MVSAIISSHFCGFTMEDLNQQQQQQSVSITIGEPETVNQQADDLRKESREENTGKWMVWQTKIEKNTKIYSSDTEDQTKQLVNLTNNFSYEQLLNAEKTRKEKISEFIRFAQENKMSFQVSDQSVGSYQEAYSKLLAGSFLPPEKLNSIENSNSEFTQEISILSNTFSGSLKEKIDEIVDTQNQINQTGLLLQKLNQRNRLLEQTKDEIVFLRKQQTEFGSLIIELETPKTYQQFQRQALEKQVWLAIQTIQSRTGQIQRVTITTKYLESFGIEEKARQPYFENLTNCLTNYFPNMTNLEVLESNSYFPETTWYNWNKGLSNLLDNPNCKLQNYRFFGDVVPLPQGWTEKFYEASKMSCTIEQKVKENQEKRKPLR